MSEYLTEFKNRKDVLDSYSAPVDALRGAKIFIAWYGYGDYCGSSLVVFEKEGKLFEVNGGHCSCYGLEGQWMPEETSWDALKIRDIIGYCEGSDVAQKKLQRIVKRHLRVEGQQGGSR